MPGPHEEIRFDKRKIKNLDHFPSALQSGGLKIRTPRMRKKLMRRIFKTCLWILLILVCVLALAFSLLKVGISGAFLTSKMQAALSQQLNDEANVKISDAKLSLDEDYHLALETQNVMVTDIKNGTKIDQIGLFRVGFAPLGLLRGKLEIAQIEIHDTNITLPQGNGPSFLDTLPKDKFGRIDPDAAANNLFGAFDQFSAMLKKTSMRVVILKNVSLRMGGDNNTPLNIEELDLRTRWKKTALKSKLQWNNNPIEVEGDVISAENATQSFKVKLSSLPLHLGASDDASPFLANGRTNNNFFRLKGTTDIALEAHRDSALNGPIINAHVVMPVGAMDVGTETMPAKFDVNMLYTPKSDKIEIAPSQISAGGVSIPFNGAIGITPAKADNEKPDNDYRFEIVSQHAVSAAAEVPDNPLRFSMKVAGQYNLDNKKIIVDEIAVNAPHGTLLGQGSLRFGEGTPETIFVLHVPQMDVAEAKQLWPINISPGARRWVVSHIFGGQLKNGSIEIAMPLGFFRNGIPSGPITGNEVKIRTAINDARSDLVGELPAIREADGKIAIDGMTTVVTLDSGVSYLSKDRKIELVEGTFTVPWGPQRPVYAEMNLVARGKIDAAGEMISLKPINARKQLPFDPDKAKGDVEAEINLKFPVTRDDPPGELTYTANVDFSDFSLPEPIENILVDDASGTAEITKSGVTLNASGLVNDLPADIKIVQPFNNSDLKKDENITFNLNDSVRAKHFAFLNTFLSGPMSVVVGPENKGKRHLSADLTNTTLDLSWAGWKKGKGMPAQVQMDIPSNMTGKSDFTIDNFSLSGTNFEIAGSLHIKDKQLAGAEFSKANLNRNDNLSIKVATSGKSYHIEATGKSFDARALLQQMGKTSGSGRNTNAISLHASLSSLTGFYGEDLHGVTATYEVTEQNTTQLTVNANTRTGKPLFVQMQNDKGRQAVNAKTTDAGSVLRFMNYYEKIRGGALTVNLKSTPGQPLSGPITLKNFEIVDEPRLAAIVSSKPAGGGKSLNDAFKGKINSSSITFDMGYAHIGKGDNYLVLDRGVVRGATVGATFQGILYDSSGNMSITGTFMPAYGLNRLFGDIPVIGQVLGNGRDRGLIGITFKIEGKMKHPQVMVNPISAIAPGIFRSIFEFQQ